MTDYDAMAASYEADPPTSAEAEAVHVMPCSDLMRHENRDCWCGPATRPVKREDGSVGWVIVHHSLDGRELSQEAGA